MTTNVNNNPQPQDAPVAVMKDSQLNKLAGLLMGYYNGKPGTIEIVMDTCGKWPATRYYEDVNRVIKAEDASYFLPLLEQIGVTNTQGSPVGPKLERAARLVGLHINIRYSDTTGQDEIRLSHDPDQFIEE